MPALIDKIMEKTRHITRHISRHAVVKNHAVQSWDILQNIGNCHLHSANTYH